ncbi:MAG: LptF/LptG family permease [bacterium]
MKILDRYLIKETFPSFIAGVFGFALILSASLLFNLVDLFVNRGTPIVDIIRIFFYELPGVLTISFPIASLFAVLLALNRLARDGEITAFRIGGIRLSRIFLPIIVFGILVSVGNFAISEFIAPWSVHQGETLIREAIFKDPLPVIQDNVFFKAPENRYIYLGRYDPSTRTGTDVLLYSLTPGLPPQVISAKRIIVEDKEWILEDGAIHYYDKDGIISLQSKFKRLLLNLNVNLETFYKEQKTTDEMSARELKERIDSFKKSGINTRNLEVDYQMKFSIPFAAAILAVLGAPLSILPVRGGRFYGLGVSIVIIFIYYIFLALGRALARNGILSPIAGPWLPNVIGFLVGVFLMWYKEERG